MRLLFGPFRWYRRLRGGTWWLCLAPFGSVRAPFWINERPPEQTPVLYREHWS